MIPCDVMDAIEACFEIILFQVNKKTLIKQKFKLKLIKKKKRTY